MAKRLTTIADVAIRYAVMIGITIYVGRDDSLFAALGGFGLGLMVGLDAVIAFVRPKAKGEPG